MLAFVLVLMLAAQPLADPEAHIVEELVVQAREPGPAWWRVEDADTTVWILGLPSESLPADVRWDRRALDRRLTGANSLIDASGVSLRGGVRDIPLLLRVRSRMQSKTPMEAGLPEPLRARFVAARERIGQPAKRYAGWQPFVAGMMLVSDTRGKRRAGTAVDNQVIGEARKRKVPVVEPARYPVAPLVRQAMDGLTPAVQQSCLAGALDDAGAPAGRYATAARAWARGDVAEALSSPRSFDKCFLVLSGGAELWSRATRDHAAAIAAALGKPGHSVAVVGLRALVAEDGVLEQLQARGLKVLGPGEAE